MNSRIFEEYRGGFHMRPFSIATPLHRVRNIYRMPCGCVWERRAALHRCAEDLYLYMRSDRKGNNYD